MTSNSTAGESGSEVSLALLGDCIGSCLAAISTSNFRAEIQDCL